MDGINYEKQAMADALAECARNCAKEPAFVAEFNRLSGCNFPYGGKDELKQFVGFVGQSVFIPMIQQWLDNKESTQ